MSSEYTRESWEDLEPCYLALSIDAEENVTGNEPVEVLADPSGDVVLRVSNAARENGYDHQEHSAGWFNSAAIRVYPDGEVRFALSIGDPCGALVVRAWRDEEGRVVLDFPGPGDSLPHVELERVNPNRVRTVHAFSAGEPEPPEVEGEEVDDEDDEE